MLSNWNAAAGVGAGVAGVGAAAVAVLTAASLNIVPLSVVWCSADSSAMPAPFWPRFMGVAGERDRRQPQHQPQALAHSIFHAKPGCCAATTCCTHTHTHTTIYMYICIYYICIYSKYMLMSQLQRLLPTAVKWQKNCAACNKAASQLLPLLSIFDNLYIQAHTHIYIYIHVYVYYYYLWKFYAFYQQREARQPTPVAAGPGAASKIFE